MEDLFLNNYIHYKWLEEFTVDDERYHTKPFLGFVKHILLKDLTSIYSMAIEMNPSTGKNQDCM